MPKGISQKCDIMRINTLLWVYIFGGLTIIFAMMTDTWLAIFTFWILVGIITYQIAIHYKRKSILKDPFEVYSEPYPNKIEKVLKPASAQYLQITLKFKTTVNVLSIGLRFEKDDEPLSEIRILDLNDWQRSDNKRPANVNEPHEIKNGTWFWEYKERHNRDTNSRITIGIKYETSTMLNGQLRIALSCIETSKDLLLPFKLENQSQIEYK